VRQQRPRGWHRRRKGMCVYSVCARVQGSLLGRYGENVPVLRPRQLVRPAVVRQLQRLGGDRTVHAQPQPQPKAEESSGVSSSEVSTPAAELATVAACSSITPQQHAAAGRSSKQASRQIRETAIEQRERPHDAEEQLSPKTHRKSASRMLSMYTAVSPATCTNQMQKTQPASHGS
jgi:hypothetical protein